MPCSVITPGSVTLKYPNKMASLNKIVLWLVHLVLVAYPECIIRRQFYNEPFGSVLVKLPFSRLLSIYFLDNSTTLYREFSLSSAQTNLLIGIHWGTCGKQGNDDFFYTWFVFLNNWCYWSTDPWCPTTSNLTWSTDVQLPKLNMWTMSTFRLLRHFVRNKTHP